MPLVKSKSKAAFQRNVGEMVKAGHPLKHALAAAYQVQRSAQKPRPAFPKRAK